MIKFVLDETLEEVGVTRNKLSVESKVRYTTITDMANNGVKQINIATLEQIVIALNELAKEKNVNRKFDVNDVFIFDFDKTE